MEMDKLSGNRPLIALCFAIILQLLHVQALQEDPNGYVAFCPCMGRFGNQVDHYLGALAFAKRLNRTLILPPWVEYKTGQASSVQVPFNIYFNVPELSKFHRVVPMEAFMAELAPSVWPKEKRVSFCYSHRKGQAVNSCNAKDGNPFGPFWDTFQVDFVASETYEPLHYDSQMTDQWTEKYPANVWPVLAFTGAPAAFPVREENVGIHKYLVWNAEMQRAGSDYIERQLSRGPFLGIHLRNGADWKRACEFVSSSPSLFSSAQCLGYRKEHGDLTTTMCLPSQEVVISQLRRTLHQNKALRHVFIATDHDSMQRTLSVQFKHLNVTFHVQPEPARPHLDLLVLARADHFIGNCVSSFSAFVKRERDTGGRPVNSTAFWGFPKEQGQEDDRRPSRTRHDPGEF